MAKLTTNEQREKHNSAVYSPLAIRLLTESKLCTDRLSLCAVTSLTATDEEESALLKERYSCIMYRGYLLRWRVDRFLNAKLLSSPVWYLWPRAEETTPKTQMKTIRTSISAETHKVNTGMRRERSRDLLLYSSCSQAQMMLWADGAPGRPFIAARCPLMTPGHSRHPNSPSDHQSTSDGQKKKKKAFIQGHCPIKWTVLSKINLKTIKILHSKFAPFYFLNANKVYKNKMANTKWQLNVEM